jgi:hypothetical protein
MGTGKTQMMFKLMYEQQDQKFIYVTPYLNEIDRLLYPNDEKSKHYTDRWFREPFNTGQGKITSLIDLIKKDFNIATTHALFQKITPELIKIIKEKDYTLIIDEALGTFDLLEYATDDFKKLEKSIKIENDKIIWTEHEYNGKKFKDVQTMCYNGSLELIRHNKEKFYIMWSLNLDLFLAFKEVYIATYLYEGSLLHYYFKTKNINYEKFYIKDYELCFGKPHYKKNFPLYIYKGEWNDIGQENYSLSSNWYKQESKTIKMRDESGNLILNPNNKINILKNNTYNYFHNVHKVNNKECVWTAYKKDLHIVSPNGFKKAFIPCSMKATNEYGHVSVMAYLVNRYLNPDINAYFHRHGIEIDQDLFALSECLQFIWRGSIRNGKELHIYIPSKRMRSLVEDWIERKDL